MRKLLSWRLAAYAAALLVLLAFPYGPLFPWSPAHPGYREARFERSKVLYPAGTVLPGAYFAIDAYIERAEKFHRLPVKSRITVVVCRGWGDFERFVPHLRGRAAAGVTLATGTVIYTTPKLAEKRLDPGEFLRHELSHAVLHQNQNLLNAVRIQRQEWFSEGLAVCFGEQKAFVSSAEFLERAARQELGPIVDPDQRDRAPKPYNMRFAYQAWRYFLEHLIENRGRELFQSFMTSYLSRPAEYRALFARTYSASFPDAIRRFQEDIRAGRWKPDPGFVSARVQ